MEKEEDIKEDLTFGGKMLRWKTAYANWFKYWPILILVLPGLLLFGLYVTKNMLRFSMATPIAFITPEDSITAPDPPSRLDSYKREIEEIKKETARRRLAMDRIIGMDFGKLGQSDEAGNRATTLFEPNRERNLPREEAGKGIEENNNRDNRENQKGQVHFAQKKGEAASKYGKQKAQNEPSRKPPQSPSAVRVDGPSKDTNFFVVRSQKENNQVEDSAADADPRFLKAVVNGNQKLTGNATITLRIIEAFTVNGKKFPPNTLVYGRVSGGVGGRLKVKISRVFSIPVQMVVFDQDFMQGIAYEYNEPVGDAVAESGNDALDEILYSIPYGGVASGIADLGRNITRKSRKIKPVFLADGYPLYVAFEK